ncbi:M81 family metallopeptidase, partial [Arcanobacterium phocae]
MRIAICGIHIESSTFTPYLSVESDFTVRRGEELLQRYPFITGVDIPLMDRVPEHLAGREWGVGGRRTW